MLPSIFPVLNKRSKTRKQNPIKSEKPTRHLRETSPDIHEEGFDELEAYIKARLDIESSLFTAFASTVSTYHFMFLYNTTYVVVEGVLYIVEMYFKSLLCVYSMHSSISRFLTVIRLLQRTLTGF